MSVELRTNHRSESQAIVDNATAISMKQYPRFDKEKFIFRNLPETSPENSGNDYMLQGILCLITIIKVEVKFTF